MNSISAKFSIYFFDYGTVLVDKNKTWQLLTKSCVRQNTLQIYYVKHLHSSPIQMLFNEVADIA